MMFLQIPVVWCVGSDDVSLPVFLVFKREVVEEGTTL